MVHQVGKQDYTILRCTVNNTLKWLEIGNYFPLSHNFPIIYDCSVPVTVTAQSKVWVCCRSLVGIAGSNPAGDMVVCLL